MASELVVPSELRLADHEYPFCVSSLGTSGRLSIIDTSDSRVEPGERIRDHHQNWACMSSGRDLQDRMSSDGRS